jgi:hypothetical protein
MLSNKSSPLHVTDVESFSVTVLNDNPVISFSLFALRTESSSPTTFVRRTTQLSRAGVWWISHDMLWQLEENREVLTKVQAEWGADVSNLPPLPNGNGELFIVWKV